MANHSSDAVILMEDGTQIPVMAQLQRDDSGNLTNWGGVLTTTPDGADATKNLTEGRLRLPSGAEADFLRLDTTDWVTTNQLRITGQGEPPF